MKVLILQDGLRKRDLAQKYIYEFIEKDHSVVFTTPEKVFKDILDNDYDVLWLDIYHVIFNVDWDLLFEKVEKPIIVDQADNRDFIQDHVKTINYQLIKKGVLCSRYLPDSSLKEYCRNTNLSLKQLTWYFDEKDIEKHISDNKHIDVSYICTLNTTKRKELCKIIEDVCKNNNLTYKIGNHYGNEYYNILGKSKVFFASSERVSLTQKYFEASLLGCTIIGDVPLFPKNDLKLYSLGDSLEETIKYALNNPLKNKFNWNIDNELKEIFSIVNND